MSEADQSVQCCIAGSGPAGAMLGLLLARAGVDVLLLEKHADFLRDFRGDTIHPSTLEILAELGLADRFLQLPHSEVSVMSLQFPDGRLFDVDFRALGGRFPFIAFVPQWDFLEFITAEAARYPNFRLRRESEVIDLLYGEGAVQGVRYRGPDGEWVVRAALTIGADGRSSDTRAAAGLPLAETSSPIDVLWFRLSRRAEDGESVTLHLGPDRIVGMFNRTDYWQVAYVIQKGTDAQVRAAGLEEFQRSIADVFPELADRVTELHDWDQVKLLTVRSDRLIRWYRPGYLAIGDAAHAMSPVAGVGINVAIQDAVAAANLLWRPLRDGRVSIRTLARVQRRRELTVRVVQAVQSSMLELGLQSSSGFQLPPVVRLLLEVPLLRDLPARLMAYGIVRPKVRAPALALPQDERGTS